MRRSSFLLVAGAFGLVAAACSTTVSNDEFKKELVTAGFPEKDAQCIIDGMSSKGIQIKRYTDMSTEDTQTIGTIAADCVMKSSGIDPNSMTMPSGN
ncbi:MAG: hypothetical protein HYX32_10105 [Actinobacteria bacterium]|nr:hypothetical protein [Actinomycetota bacterium]